MLSKMLLSFTRNLESFRRHERRGRSRSRNSFEQLEMRALLSSAPSYSLVADLFSTITPKGSEPKQLTQVGTTTFFVAKTEANGDQLWKTDGTTAGTVLVKDIVPGPSSEDLEQLTNVGGKLFFVADDGAVGRELWKSDGTSAGTVLVKDIDPGAGSSFPDELTAVGNTLFFTAEVPTFGAELWKSDGTAGGTTLVKDILLGDGYSYVGDLVNVNGTLFFRASNGETPGKNGFELWKSNGTEAGTVMVKDINTGTESSYPSFLTNVGGTLFFGARDSVNGYALWKSNGTAAGTVFIRSGLPSSNSIGSPVAVGSALYFTFDDGVHGEELWKSNGTAAGTVMVKDIQAGSYSSAPDYLTNIGGVLYFSADNGTHGYELWKSDGTVAGTTMVKDIYVGGASSQSQRFTNVNGTIYFSARNAENNYELWKTNGTSAGTTLVKEVGPGAVGSISHSFDDRVFLNANGVLVYVADGNLGQELWRSDGSSAGTFLLKDIETGTGNAEVSNLTNLNGTLLFSGTNGTTGRQALWKLSGSTPVLIKNLWPGSDVTLHDFVVLGNRVLFTGDSPAGQQLWATDGTTAGTIPLGGAQPRYTTVVGSVAYFSALDGVNGRELWRSDGTAAGTKLVKDIAPGSTSSIPYSLTNVGGKLYFTAETAASGYELWKSDGTAAGTVLVKEIRSGTGSSYPFNQTNVNGTLYFSANDGTNGSELWKSDGTAAGTVMVTNIAAGAARSTPGDFLNIAGTLFFSANDGTTGFELWKSNGTAAGTVRVKDINPGSATSNPSNLQNVAGKLYFTASTAANGTEVWKSDGTAAGTVLLKDIRAGVGGSDPKLAVAGGKLYVNANDGAGSQLWLTDGTTVGTVKAPNAAGQPVALNPQFVVDVKGVPYFAGTSVAHGQELFALNVPQNFAASTNVDSYVVTYSSSNVVVTRSINGGAAATLGTFTLATPLSITGLTAVDLVRVVGTSGADTITVANTGTVGSTGINVNSSSLVISGAPILTISGAHSNDYYRFDADAALGLISLDEAAGGVDTLDFSLTTTLSVAVNLIAPGNQNINAKLSLKLNSATTFENIIGTPNGDLLLGNTLVNSINGGNGHDVVVGNAGNDRLVGGSGRDILIGGAGVDALFGGDDEDILIAGKTDYDGVYSKLVELKTEWTSSNTYATRITRLRAGVGATLSKLKAMDTVDNDAGEIDTMTGGPDLPTAETDWFFRASNDVITDLLSETIDLL